MTLTPISNEELTQGEEIPQGVPPNRNIPKRVEISKSGPNPDNGQKSHGPTIAAQTTERNGELLARIVANRITTHLSHTGPDFLDNQFGFRFERSTIDAIDGVVKFAQSAISQGGVTLAMTINNINAFNLYSGVKSQQL
ncbi:uncharacterized protein LOC122528541 [Frieseomelitta varia]|uniref:uncharacterized protein LOC122528541 n=1 Tax=Frieseomelitta varia TaxID=561572 RepID=UPI001CB6AC10|nr:uncharacterized protein LOC122528541 [Frieseomelitta varia]